jgi:hypothetical protein
MCEVDTVNKNIRKHWIVGGMGECWSFLDVFRDAVDDFNVLWMLRCILKTFLMFWLCCVTFLWYILTFSYIYRFLRFRCIHNNILKFWWIHTKNLNFRCIHTKFLKFRYINNKILKFRCIHTKVLMVQVDLH